MKRSRLLCAVCACVFSFISMSANSALIPRLGGQAYYDDVLDVTWLADANYAKTSGFHGNDYLSWYEANDFIAELNNTSHLGIDTWRLPSMDVNGDAYIVKCSVATEIECRDSELGYMSVVYAADAGNPLGFDNVLFNYWSSTDYDADNVDWPGGATCNVGDEGLCAWRQGFGFDSQNYVRKTYGEPYDSSTLGYSVWAVASGDALPPTNVTIDIKPSRKPGKPNEIDLNKDKNLKVAIVGTADFDALQIDPSTVKFGPTGVEASPVRYKGLDYNRDGFSDLVLTFKLKDTGIACGDTEATLMGQTFPDPVINIVGSDSFTVEPCP